MFNDAVERPFLCAVLNDDSGTTLESEQGQNEEEKMKGLTVSVPEAWPGQPAPCGFIGSTVISPGLPKGPWIGRFGRPSGSFRIHSGVIGTNPGGFGIVTSALPGIFLQETQHCPDDTTVHALDQALGGMSTTP
jgi:hypothetical protein